MIYQLYKISWIKLFLLKRFQRLNPLKKIFSIVELDRTTKRTISNGNADLSNLDTLLLEWWKTFAQVLILKEKFYYPFWNSISKEISNSP